MSTPSGRHISVMLTELKKLKAELLPSAEEEELKGFDDFQKCKHGLNVQLRDLRKDLQDYQERAKSQKEETKDAVSIKLQQKMHNELKQVMSSWEQLKELLVKDEKKKGSKRLPDGELASRRKALQVLGEEIKDLTPKISGGFIARTEEERQMAERVEKRKAEREAKLKGKRRAPRDKKGKKGKEGKDGVREEDEEYKFDSVPATQEEQLFYDKVEANIAEQDEILDQINKGLDELKDIASSINKELEVQAAMIEEVGSKIDAANNKLRTANGRLQDILEQSGGVSRWCPILICLCLLLGLVGYILHLA